MLNFFTILPILAISANFDNFWQRPIQRHQQRQQTLVTFETLTTILTIDDNFHNSYNCFCHFDNWKDNPEDLWHLRHWLQFWQLRTWIHDNLYYLTINCDTGQHSQFLRCLISYLSHQASTARRSSPPTKKNSMTTPQKTLQRGPTSSTASTKQHWKTPTWGGS